MLNRQRHNNDTYHSDIIDFDYQIKHAPQIKHVACHEATNYLIRRRVIELGWGAWHTTCFGLVVLGLRVHTIVSPQYKSARGLSRGN